jgi:methyl-accepting chemotaxis protein
MFSFSIKTRLRFGFYSLALLCGVVGGVGYWGLQRTTRSLQTAGREALPATQALLTIRGAAAEIKSAERTLLMPSIEAARITRQYGFIKQAWEDIDSVYKQYAALPHPAGEAAQWAEFEATWAKWKSGHEQLLAMIRDIDAQLCRDPMEMRMQTASARFAHTRWVNELNSAIGHGQKFTGQLDHMQCAFGRWLDQYKTTNPEMTALLETVKTCHRDVHQSGEAINALLATGKAAEARAYYDQHTLASMQAILAQFDKLDELAGGIEKRYAAANKQMDDNSKLARPAADLLDKLETATAQRVNADVDAQTAAGLRIQRLSAGLVVAGIVIALLMGFLVTQRVINPLRSVIDRVHEIAQGDGDLTQRVTYNGNDELGELSTNLNQFIEKLQHLIRDVMANSEEVAGAACEIAAATTQMSQNLNEQSAQTQQVSAAVEELSATVTEVAQKTTQAAHDTEQASDRATTGGQVVARTVTGINSIATIVGASAASIQELGRRGAQINTIISTINDIADQTNLLALNAAIEAARAGEHGRGFAVVADEVRKLAERTSLATREVADSIHAIQGDTSRAVEQMDRGAGEVEQGVHLAEETGAVLNGILTDLTSLSIMTQAVAAASEEQSATTTQIAQNLECINAIASQTAISVNQGAEAAQSLADKSSQLRALVAQFTV